jgi:hypothetical protein
MNYTYPLIATSRSNETRIFRDADTFLAFARDRRNGGVGAYWLEARVNLFSGKSPKLFRASEGGLFDRWRETTRNEWIVRDDRGRVVDRAEIAAAKGDGPRRYYRYRADVVLAAKLGLPIPGTSNRRGGNKRYSKNGRNGTYNRDKGLFLFEDNEIARGNFTDL